VERILSHVQEEDGSIIYQLQWVGYSTSDDDTTWHRACDIPNCSDLIEEYWGQKTGSGTDLSMFNLLSPEIPICAGAVEVGWDDWLASPHREDSIAAMDKEWHSMTSRVFPGNKHPRLIPLTPGELDHLTLREKKTCLKGRFSNTVKRSGRRKSRIVAQDLKCLRKCHAADVHAPTPTFNHFRLMLAASPLSKYRIHTTDFDTAYLQSPDLEREHWSLFAVWDGSTKDFRYVWKTGPIYGEQPAGKDWKSHLKNTLCQGSGVLTYAESMNAPSIYADIKNDSRTYVYVDDPLSVTPKNRPDGLDGMNRLYQDLKADLDFKEVTELLPGQEIDYLSFKLTVDSSGCVRMSNPNYVEGLLGPAGLLDCNPASLPLTKELLCEIRADVLAGEFMTDEQAGEFRSILGAVEWLAVTTHPSIAFASSILAKGSRQPTQSHGRAIKHLLRYLAGRRDEGITFGEGDGSGLTVWTDSDLAGTYKLDGELRSRLGIAVTYNGYLVGWNSKHIPTTCVSTCEAELHALSEGVKMALHMKYVCEELGLAVQSQIPIMVDAKSTVDFSDNPKGLGRMKHLDLRWGWIRDIKDSGEIKITHIPGTTNKADFFTKIHPVGEHATKLGILLQEDVNRPARGHA
jgi:hypothetical protein